MKYALVTGGSRGLGRAVCLKLAKMQIPVLINYQSNREAAQQVLDEIAAAGGEAELMPFREFDTCKIQFLMQKVL